MNFGPETAKMGPEILATLCKFCVLNVNADIKIGSLMLQGPITFLVSNDIASGSLKWQYSVNCHINTVH